MNRLYKKALDLINRKDETIEALIAGQETLQKALAEKNAEIERLQKFKSYFDDLYGCNLEVLGWHENGDVIDFNEFYDSAIGDMENAEHHIEYTIRTAKAEAIKEFAERLKFEKATGMNWFGKERYTVRVDDIDSLVKEMVGDTDVLD